MRSAIIIHHNRPSIATTAKTLVDTQLFGEILVITTSDISEMIRNLNSEIIRLINFDSIDPFNKSKMINIGLKNIKEKYVLISDADIIWSKNTITAMMEKVEQANFDLCYVDNVIETNLATRNSIKHTRYIAVVNQNTDNTILEIKDDVSQELNRPGYGLLYGHIDSFFIAGGYKEDWPAGWGWEDVDFLVRAEILDLQCTRSGNVHHISHEDAARDLRGRTKSQSRNANIASSIRGILDGKVVGPIGSARQSQRAIIVRLPSDFFHNPDC